MNDVQDQIQSVMGVGVVHSKAHAILVKNRPRSSGLNVETFEDR